MHPNEYGYNQSDRRDRKPSTSSSQQQLQPRYDHPMPPPPSSYRQSHYNGSSPSLSSYAGSSFVPQKAYAPQPPMPVHPAARAAHTNIPMAAPVVRKKIVQIPLTPQGHLVIDMPVSDKVVEMGKYRDAEFTHMRYTAVTCKPDEFSTAGYTLRQQEYGRKTELFIVLTMYNEDEHLFCKSMQSVMKNISYLCSRTRSKTWGADGWKRVVVCIVSDGRAKINPRVLNVLGIMGVYQEGLMKDSINGKPVEAHLFEYTSQVCVTEDLKVHGHEKDYVPVQILFCLKEKNAKKINSHRWFFNAFGPLLRPTVCILIDVGTKPTGTSLYHLWKAFDKDPSVAGACGEIYAELGTGCSNLLNPLVAAQNFEYKTSNILDKPLESVMGYISVLPGAFSAYRYLALQGRPLQMYFKGEALHDGADIFAANMYLAEDRILCFEVVTKRGASWLLKYVKAAKAETDVPATAPEFISQRRRWLNGSFFAGVHALTHWYFIFRSNHTFGRKIVLLLQFIYNFISMAFNWFALSSFYLTFYFLGTGASDGPYRPFYGYENSIFQIMRQIYIMAIVIIFITSMGNRPQGSKWIYVICIFLFAIIMAVMLYLTGFTAWITVKSLSAEAKSSVTAIFSSSPAFRDLVLAVISTLGLYFFSSLMYLDPWHMLTSSVQYMLFLPSFVNILNVYAFCNLHDVSWGTKGDNAPTLGGVTAVKGKDGQEMVQVEFPTDKSDINEYYNGFIRKLREPKKEEKKAPDSRTQQEDYFKSFRTNVILSWMFSNAILIVILTSDVLSSQLYAALSVDKVGSFNPYLQFIFYSVLGLSAVRFLGSTLYLITHSIC